MKFFNTRTLASDVPIDSRLIDQQQWQLVERLAVASTVHDLPHMSARDIELLLHIDDGRSTAFYEAMKHPANSWQAQLIADRDIWAQRSTLLFDDSPENENHLVAYASSFESTAKRGLWVISRLQHYAPDAIPFRGQLTHLNHIYIDPHHRQADTLNRLLRLHLADRSPSDPVVCDIPESEQYLTSRLPHMGFRAVQSGHITLETTDELGSERLVRVTRFAGSSGKLVMQQISRLSAAT